MYKKFHPIFFAFLLLMCIFFQNITTVAAEASSEQDVSVQSSKQLDSGWFKKGKYQYYRLNNGKLCTKNYVKIGKYYYSFDKKGRMKKGLVSLGSNQYGYFSRKTGRFVYFIKDLKVINVYARSVIATSNSERYSVPFTKNTWINKNGTTMRKLQIKKNTWIRVYYRKGIMESDPAKFQLIDKVKIK